MRHQPQVFEKLGTRNNTLASYVWKFAAKNTTCHFSLKWVFNGLYKNIVNINDLRLTAPNFVVEFWAVNLTVAESIFLNAQ